MDPTVSQLEELRAAEFAAIDTILDKAKKEGREPSEAEVEKIANHTATAKRHTDQIEFTERKRAVLEEAANAREAGKSAPLPGKAVTEKVRDAVQDDPKRGWKSFGEFLGGVKTAAIHGGYGIDKRLYLGAVTGMGTKTGPDGGFALPPQFSTAVWDGANVGDAENLFASTDQHPIEGKELTINANAETSRATGSRYGGVQGYWMEEGGTFTASRPKLRQVTLRPHKLGALVYATSELLDQAPAMESYITRAVSEEIRFMINDAIVRGNGTGKPSGILNAGCLVSVSAETGQTSTEPLLAENIDKMWSRCHAKARSSAVWYINQELEPYLQAIGREVGVSGVPAYMPPGGLSASPYGTLKGRPVVLSEFCAGAATVGDIILANFGWYATGTRGGMRSDSSIHVQFTTDELTFRFIFYVDGQPWLASAITPYKATGTHTLSPFVALATRS